MDSMNPVLINITKKYRLVSKCAEGSVYIVGPMFGGEKASRSFRYGDVRFLLRDRTSTVNNSRLKTKGSSTLSPEKLLVIEEQPVKGTFTC